MNNPNDVVPLSKPKADYLKSLIDTLYQLNGVTISILNDLYHSSPPRYSSYTGTSLEIINNLIKMGFVMVTVHAGYSEPLVACTKKGGDACKILKIDLAFL